MRNVRNTMIAVAALAAWQMAAAAPCPGTGLDAGTRSGPAAAATPPPPISANLREPIPTFGAVPPIVRDLDVPSLYEIIARGFGRGDREAIAEIVRTQLRSRDESVRQDAFEALTKFSDAAAMVPLVDALAESEDHVRRWLLDHLAACGADGQFGLAYAAIVVDDADFRNAAVARLQRPLPSIALHAIDAGLRNHRHAAVNAAGWLAAQFNVIEAIPPLIFAQAAEQRVESQGDLAWIAIGTTTAYVANVVPVVGGSAGAFQPILGTMQTGTLLRVMDAVVVEGEGSSHGMLVGSSIGSSVGSGGNVGGRRMASGGQSLPSLGLRSGRIAAYRLDAHHALVALSSAEWGHPTDHLGYDMRAWYRWFNDEFVPHMQEKEAIRSVAWDIDDD